MLRLLIDTLAAGQDLEARDRVGQAFLEEYKELSEALVVASAELIVGARSLLKAILDIPG